MTVLGGSEKLRKSGRYARVMGNFWRHPKLDSVGDAACGVLVKVWSYCADQGVDAVPPGALRRLYGSPKNGPKLVRELVVAGLLEQRDDGAVMPHDWHDHNPIARSRAPEREANERRTRGEREANERQAKLEIVQESTCPRARSSLHVSMSPDPDLPSVDQAPPRPAGAPPESGVFKLEPVEPQPAKKARRAKQEPKAKAPAQLAREGFRDALLAAFRERGLQEPRALQAALLKHGVAAATDHAAKASLSYDAAMAKLCSDVAEDVSRGRRLWFAVVEWQPKTPIAAPGRGLKPTRAPATTSADFPADAWRKQLEKLQSRQGAAVGG